MKEDTKKRRAERRAAVARERADRLEALKAAFKRRGRRFFYGKARSGDTAKFDFKFSGLPVPVDRPDDPDGKALVRQTELVEVLVERDGQSKDN